MKIFGLEDNASKDQIRRAYRKLAMKYHPDKNADPRAHQLFVDLAEAYEILMGNQGKRKEKEKTRKEKSFEERRKEAEMRFKTQQKREQREQEAYYEKLTLGRKWKIFRAFARLSALLALILLVEPLLPKHYESQVIEAYSPKYNGLFDGEVICFKTNKQLEIFINSPSPSMYLTFPKITVERSWIFHNPVRVIHYMGYSARVYDVDFSVISVYPAMSFILLIPIVTIYFRRKTLSFTIFYLLSFYLIGGFTLYFLWTQDRWLHLITFGFI